ncbi:MULTISPECIES: winged helix-turn-helix domain-containing protein [unclassified Streptomyces]|uniref:GntR family transcriptional regulator n=1 Tax=unclassified Streptomyces TaxID=2593676 RepID=UPI00136D745F|nr:MULTISPECIES: winged helix-turn-helix domain-containing protein [unclassified Streptomyces]NEA05228.1 winged helix-turn-helix transcriptional regulator [Streptomyces sp. SID10116]MYY82482.1 GntR family transcriptional regulator [Streptomyces sp. SID335]MYZ18088.1 GntR family transcriptional regulator [Streptomyces sp. SID337]NDZ91066.1 winged helix-turn-helix transcriptional regulator [Streptomyces sp. SID10115]NEB45399.1 winged helix-turn-helix transcriptional regulator [Streptomyces sp. S
MTLPLEDDSRPPYVQAAEVLRREISTGRLKPGDKLPSSRALQDRYGIASSTVQNALRLLKTEGLVYSVQGRGSFVRNSPAGMSAEATREEQGPEEAVEATGKTPDLTADSLAADMQAMKADIKRLEETVHRLLTIVESQQQK